MVFSGDGDVIYSYTIPEERLFVEEELYNFGALSDTHQGIRYGSTDIPYNHFINAAETLYEKGAITIGICGDFSYENIESNRLTFLLIEAKIKLSLLFSFTHHSYIIFFMSFPCFSYSEVH